MLDHGNPTPALVALIGGWDQSRECPAFSWGLFVGHSRKISSYNFHSKRAILFGD